MRYDLVTGLEYGGPGFVGVVEHVEAPGALPVGGLNAENERRILRRGSHALRPRASTGRQQDSGRQQDFCAQRAPNLPSPPRGRPGGRVRVVTIVPDTKDWTWVLERPCPECGLDTQGFAREAVAGMLRANADDWQEVLAGPGGGDARRRPSPDVWSPLEYGCHVRDVFRLYDERLVLMLTVDGPHYPDWDQDATAVADRYGEQDPAVVAADLGEAAGLLAARFEGVSGDQWQRTGTRSDGARFTVESFARYFIHDPVHHLYDVTGARR
jgi:hypothetical protein